MALASSERWPPTGRTSWTDNFVILSLRLEAPQCQATFVYGAQVAQPPRDNDSATSNCVSRTLTSKLGVLFFRKKRSSQDVNGGGMFCTPVFDEPWIPRSRIVRQ